MNAPAPTWRQVVCDLGERFAVFLAALCLGLRPLASGQTAAEPETAFIGVLAALSFLLWLSTRLLAGRFTFPRTRALWGLPLLLLLGALSLQQATVGGAAQPAMDLYRAWVNDILLFLVILDTAGKPAVFRLYLSCLLAGLAVAVTYGLYLRWYGLEYLRAIWAQSDTLAARAEGTAREQLFAYRLASDRIAGPFGFYPNAFAGYLLLLAPLLFGLLVGRNGQDKERGRLAILLGAATVLAFVYTGSKAGFLVAKLFELSALGLLVSERTDRWRRRVDLLGLLVLLTLACLALAGLIFLALWKGLGVEPAVAESWAETAFGLFWFGEWLLLLRRVRQEASPGRGPGLAGSISAAALALLLASLLAGALPPLRLSGRNLTEPAQRNVLRQLSVRGNYWIAAARMIADHPWRGVGLNNFQYLYTRYKTLSGWETRRAHNHYLQLAADGGLLYALAFLVFWLAVLRPRTQTPAPPEAERSEPVDAIRRLGLLVGIATFALFLAGYLYGWFGGLGLEFIEQELHGASRRGGAAVLVHGGVHLLLPIAWFVTYRFAWKRAGTAGLAPVLLRLSVLLLLLHIIVDFHFYLTSIHTVAWAIAALALAAICRERFHPALPPRLATGGAAGALVAGMILLVLLPLRHWQGVLAADRAQTAVQAAYMADPVKRRQAFDTAQTLLDNALRRRPYDPHLVRRRAELNETRLRMSIYATLPRGLNPAQARQRYRQRLAHLPPALEPLRQAVLADRQRLAEELIPDAAAAHYALSQTLVRLFPDNFQKKIAAISALEQACHLYRYRPLYHFELGKILLQTGQKKPAREHIGYSLSLNMQISDNRAKLTPSQVREAGALLTQCDS